MTWTIPPKQREQIMKKAIEREGNKDTMALARQATAKRLAGELMALMAKQGSKKRT